MIKIGPHLITNRSIEHPDLDEMLHGETLDVIYTDPPWGDSNMKYWVTLNKKMTGDEFTPLSYAALIQRIFELSNKHLKGFLFIETGLRWLGQVEASLRENGYYSIGHQLMTYSSGDCVLLYGSTIPCEPFSLDVSKMRGATLPRSVLMHLNKKGIVFDPCCGMGYTAKAAVNCGMVFRGNEFNSARLLKTIEFLERST
jgi:hypothetical protein